MTAYYIDAKRGNDLNDGISAPWKSLTKIAAVTGAGAGDQFLLADDSFWRITPASRIAPPTSWAGTEAAPIIIGKYSPSSQSTGQRPLITMNVETVAADWTYDVTLNGWKYVYPTANMNNAALVRIGDTWLASAIGNNSDGAVESVDGRYVVRLDNQTLVLYAPAGASNNPVYYYGKVVVSAQAVGVISLSSNRKWVTVQDIAFRESGCGVSCASFDANPANFVVQRCSMEIGCLAFVYGVAPGVTRAWIRDNEVSDFGAIGIHVSGLGVTYAEVCRNKVRGGVQQWSQGGIYVQARNAAREGFVYVYDNEVSGCRWGTLDKRYDGCGIYMESGSDGVQVFGNVVHDCFVGLQDNSGRRNVWSGNLIYNCRRGIRITDENNNNQSDARLYNNTFLVGDLRQEATKFGNVTQGADYPGIWMYKGTGTLNVTAKNNIIANIGGQRGRAVFGLPAVYASSTYDLSGNWVYGFETDVLRGDNDGVPSPAPTVTHAGTTDPRPYLDAIGRLKRPYLVGEITMPNPLGGAGAYVQGVRLQDGKRLDPTRVPVGACMERAY